MRLLKAHIELAKAEANAIKGEIAKVAALVGLAVAVSFMAAILAVVGTSLFLGEWLLGSMGWGVLHGVLLFIAIAVACSLAALGISGASIGRAFIVGAIVAIVVGVAIALALPNRAYDSIGQSLLPGIEPGIRPLLVGAVILATVGLLIGVVAAIRGRAGGVQAGGMVGGLAIGAIVGAISSVDLGPQVGAGIGIAVGYVVWIALMIADVMRSGIDAEALKTRFYPAQTIETSKETLAWLQSKMPPGTGS